MDNDLKALFDEQMRTYEALKAANEENQKSIQKLGAEDSAKKEETLKINKRMDELHDAIKATEKTALEAATLANRPSKSEQKDEEQKAIEQFNLQTRLHAQAKGKRAPDPVDADGFRAYKSALVKWMREGAETMTDMDKKAMSVGSDPDGGYLVTPDMGGRIIMKVFETSPMRQVASQTTISTDALEGINDLDEAGAGWVGETASRTATDSPTVGKWRIPVHESYAMPEATQKVLDDAMFDVESWLAGKIADKLARTENTAFVSGSGVAQPRGFYNYTTAATVDASRSWGVFEHILTGTNAGFGTAPNGSDKIISLVHSMKAAYRNGARFFMNKTTLGAVRTLKGDATLNGYIWLPSMFEGQPSTLLGYPVTELEDLPNYSSTAGTNALWFGNMGLSYQIVDRTGIRTLRDPFTNKPYVRFYATKRVGGDAVHFEALKALKFST
jgi:HK97 family phage major capsid protein